MAIFTAGIVWDPREPLPPEFQSLTGPGYPHVLLAQKNVKYSGGMPVSDTGSSTSIINERSSSASLKILPDGVIEEPTRNILPPMSVSIDGRIIDDTASITVTQAFWNNAEIPIHQASYVFPLPSGCTVTNFSCRVGREKVLRARAQPKKEAQEAFRNAIVTGHTAALLQQNTPEIFTASLGNVPPDTRLETKLTYITLLKRQFSEERNVTTLSIPTAIANRYGNTPADIPTPDFQGVPRTFTLQLEVSEAEERLEIKSESHKIFLDHSSSKPQASNWQSLSRNSYESTSEVAVVRLDPAVGFLHEDFVLSMESSSSNGTAQPHAWLESHPFLENQNALMLTIPSSFMEEERKISARGEVLFLVDRSGSMRDKIEAVKSSLKFFLKGIPLGRTFNIWSFGSDHVKLWDRSQIYSAESLQVALDYVEAQFKADMGGTELVPALSAILQNRDFSCPCDVIIMTDGEVWRLDETLALVQRTRTVSGGAVRFFSLGIGAHVSHALVQGIASRGGGYSEVIPKASMGGWEDRLVAMLKAALTSHVSTLNVKLNNETSSRFLTSPADAGTLNPFQGNRIFALSTSDSPLDQLNSVIIEKVNSDGHQVSAAVEITRLKKQEATIHNLAVRAILDDLEHSPSSISIASSLDTSSSARRTRLSEAQATDLACRFSLLSKWTSFFLQQENVKLKDDDESIHTIIPVRDAEGDLDLLRPRGGSRHPASQKATDTSSAIPARLKSDDSTTGDVQVESRNDTRDEIEFGFYPRTPNKSAFCDVLSLAGDTPSDSMCQIIRPESKQTKLDHLRALRTARSRVGRHRSESISRCLESLISPASELPSTAIEPARISTSLTMKRPSTMPQYLMTKSAPEEPVVHKRHMSVEPTFFESYQSDPQKEFVASLLAYQNFDGSINVDVQSLLEPSLTQASQKIEEYAVDDGGVASASAALLSYTVIVVVSFERHLQDCKGLWDLMRAKAVDYVRSQVPDESKMDKLMEFAKELLAGRQFALYLIILSFRGCGCEQ
ncbi:von Willebrand factor type A domain-containing protein [Hypoxylon rubiginosum]|uniref:von Willebrand factor type A domain-containing protein n=1 Tax=Hypoxylon rubiginosum TaxID=110542 RepID=A0ACB9YN90_9PEZI|nr:von Willebrand factor type A domain-containing protein [Hypoxylon rubiginosum]